MILARRRLFGLGAALLAAPAIVRVASIMPVSVAPFVPPRLWGDGIHDDTEALQAILDAEFQRVNAAGGGFIHLPPTEHFYRVTKPLRLAMVHNTTLSGYGAAVGAAHDGPAFIVTKSASATA